MNLHPTKLELTNAETLRITWSDGLAFDYRLKALRDHCPCATCREKRNAPEDTNPLRVLSLEEAKPLRLNGVRPVGNYAYSFDFSDGHDTGIYTLEFLRDFGQSGSSRAATV